MINENIETRVGYKTISLLNDALKDYIKAFTEDNGVYRGDVYFLYLFSKFDLYLKGN